MTAASEAKSGTLYEKSKIVFPLQNNSQEMRCPQKETPLITENSKASGIVNKSIQPQTNLAVYILFHGVTYQCEKKQSKVSWDPVTTSLGDYSINHPPPPPHLINRG